METSFAATLLQGYEWRLSLIAAVCIGLISFLGKHVLLRLVPTFRDEAARNEAALAKKMEKPNYAANQQWNRKWGLFFWVAIFGAILPFTLTADTQPWWRVLRDIVVILMVYDFFYYLTHRFVFHDNGFMGGPLIWVHAVHHRQHNPCRMDASYIHPIEVAIGLGLFAAVIFGLSAVLGRFSVVTLVVTWTAFSQINLLNHMLWENDRFPFRYMSYLAKMHHHHHARFTGGNYATISLLFDWMFGTLDHGKGWKTAPVKTAVRQENV